MTDLEGREAIDERIQDTVQWIASQARLVEELQSDGQHSAEAEDVLEAMALRLEDLNEEEDLALAGAVLL
jgi:hypothetical protein